MGFLVGTVVTNSAYPAWRIEMYVHGYVGKVRLDVVTYPLCLNAVVARVTSGKGLHAVAIYLRATTHDLFGQIWRRFVFAFISCGHTV